MVRKGRQRKVKDGDGSHLKRYRFWHLISYSRFYIDYGEHRYHVQVDYWDDKAALYTDGKQTSVSPLPASFPLDGARLEVAATMYGMKRAHLVDDHTGNETQMHASKGTAEAGRAKIAVKYPRTSRAIGAAAVVVLLASLAFWVPTALEFVTHLDVVADVLGGSFTSPITMPAWLSTPLTVAGVIAAVERALTLRSHWLIDAETFWLD